MNIPRLSTRRGLLKTAHSFIWLMLLSSVFGMTTGIALAQTIRYIKPTASGTGNGTSWANASDGLQSIINASAPGDQVWVAAGTYKPTTGTDQSISFVMRTGVAIYGGFAGTENALNQRPAINPTSGNPSGSILSGNIGAAGTTADNSYHVVNNPNRLNSAILDGFVITGGAAIDAGGGMYNTGSSPTIRNCSFQNNTVFGNGGINSGGAIYNNNSNPTLTNCFFQNNTVSGSGGIKSGGAIDNTNSSSPSLINCAFLNNTASGGNISYGGAISNNSSRPQLTNCSLQGNSATQGGAIFNTSSVTQLTNCVLFGNGGNNSYSNLNSSTVTATYSLFDASVTGVDVSGPGNLTTGTSPFVSANGVALAICSPANNAGNNAAYAAANGPTTDLAGNPRIFGTAIDMGAVEYQAATVASLTRLYVKAGATGANTGVNWADAFTDLQSALNYACSQNLTQIWVAAGNYKPTSGINRNISFAMRNGVVIYGGFAGDEPSLGARVLTYPSSTTLSGDIGTAGTASDNSYHVISNPPGLNNTAILDGVVITGGNADGGDESSAGGGIYNNGGAGNAACSPTFRNCSFVVNTAAFGGAIFNDGGSAGNSNPTLTNCVFQGNTASRGGAILNRGFGYGNSSPVLTNCAFQGNTASQGGAMFSSGDFEGNSNPMLINCVVFGNGGSNTFSNSNASVSATYSLFETGTTNYNTGGTGNLTTVTSPFASPTSVALNACSPAINAGSNAANTTPTDLAGNPRKYGGTIDMGAIEFQGTPNQPTTLTTQPAAASTVCAGGAVSVAVVASGTGPFTYQWYKDGTAIPTQTAASLNLTNVQTTDAGSYSVVVTGACNSLTSTAFTLTVTPLPVVSVTPSATAVCAGQPATFAATPGLAAYRWNTPNGGPVLTTASISVSVAGTYSLTVTNASGCTATAQASLTVNALPTVSITPSATAICAGQNAIFTATPGLASYRWTTPDNGPVLTTASISVSVAGTYSLTVTNASGCTATAQASLTVNPLPTLTIQGLVSSICQEAAPVSLPGTGNPSGGVFTIDGTPATTFNPASLSVGQHTVVYSFTNTSGCSNTASQTVTVKPTPQTPTIATQSGHAYPAGVSSLIISQNTGDVVLTASGCMGGTITWAGGNTTLAVSTVNTGTQTFTATCSQNGCTSPIATAMVTVVATTLSVLHRDGNGNTSTNTLAPYLQLNNEGTTAIPYAEITVRYWLTVENFSPLLFAINYAQLGSDKVHLKYVPATTGNPKASGYIEFSFDGSAGSLAPLSNSGPIQDIINKQDYSYFDQSNDYSYAPVGQYTPNQRITAYRNGVLFWGQEPGVVTPTRSLKAQLQNNTGDGANTIEAVLQVTNDGSLPVNYSNLKVRYYFTQDNTQPLVLSQAGYTALGSGNVTAQLVSISPALGGADTYLELSFAGGLGQLAPGASTGGVTYQIRHADYSGFTQANDYSYQGTGGLALAPHVVVLVGGQRVWGTEPGASGRLAASEPETPLSVRVLGNPVQGLAIGLEVRGAEGQPLRVQVMDQQGRLVSERAIDKAGPVEGQTVPIGNQPAGLLLLRVSTPTQSQTVKVLKAE